MLQSPRLRCCSGNPDGIATGLPTRCTNFPDLVLGAAPVVIFMDQSGGGGPDGSKTVLQVLAYGSLLTRAREAKRRARQEQGRAELPGLGRPEP